jgi:hypothetical protein
VEVVEIAAQRVEQLLQSLQGRALASGLIGRQHALGDSGGLRHLILLLAVAVPEPPKCMSETVQQRCTHDCFS